jgi:predicted transcriptional regulator
MRRTNIYLDEAQCARLDHLAEETGVTRSEIVRRLVEQGLGGSLSDLEGDLAAITESFGVLAHDDVIIDRGVDERARYLNQLWRR